MELMVQKLLLIYQNNENWAIFRAVLHSRIDQLWKMLAIGQFKRSKSEILDLNSNYMASNNP